MHIKSKYCIEGLKIHFVAIRTTAVVVLGWQQSRQPIQATRTCTVKGYRNISCRSEALAEVSIPSNDNSQEKDVGAGGVSWVV